MKRESDTPNRNTNMTMTEGKNTVGKNQKKEQKDRNNNYIEKSKQIQRKSHK